MTQAHIAGETTHVLLPEYIVDEAIALALVERVPLTCNHARRILTAVLKQGECLI